MTPGTTEELKQRATFVGPSDWIVEQLHAIRDATGVDVEFVARSYFPTLPFDRQIELMDRLATEVMPHL